MNNIDKTEQKIARLNEELARAKEKAEEWRCKVNDLKKQLESAENLRIVQIVRNTEITPEMLKQLLKITKDEEVSTVEVLPKIIKNERVYEDENIL